MNDQVRTNQELLKENAFLKQKIQELEQSESECKRAEEALRQSEGKYRTLIENIQDGIYILDSSGNFTFVNDVIVKRSGFPAEWFLGRSYLDVIIEEDRERVQKYFNAVMDGKTQLYDLSYPSKSGNLLHVEVSTAPLFDGAKVIALLGISRDISERRHLEKAFVKSEDKFRQVTENMVDCVALVDASGTYQYVTPSYREALGYGPEDMVGITGFSLLHPDELERVLKLYMDGIEQGLCEVRYETRLRHRNGHYVPMEVRARSFKETQGKIIGGVVAARDITKRLQIDEERKRAEEEFRKSEEKYRTIIENMEDGFHEVDLKGNYILFNESTRKMMGYEREDLLGMNYRQYADEENASKVYKVYNQVYRTGESVKNFEWQIIRKDGDRRDIEVSISLIRNTEGHPTGFRGIVRDTTDRKQAENALRESENKFRSFADHSLVGIYLNQDGVLKYVNPKFAEIFGYTVEECSDNMFFRDLVYTEDYVTVKEQVRKRLSGEIQRVHYTFRGIKKTGEIIHVEVFGSSIMFNGRSTVTGTILDITDRKRAEDALRESEKKYRLVLEANPDPMIVYDIEGKVIYLNPAFTSVFGWSLEERIGKKMDDFVPEESWLETRMMIDMVIAGKNFSGIETRRLTRDGKIIPVSISGSSYRNQEGNIEASVINLRDITESKRVETEKKKLEEQYRQAQKMEAIGQLAGGVAHDFNNMLNIILGYSQLALLKIEPSSPFKANLQEIMNAAQRSADLVRQLLAFARKQTIAPKALDLNDAVAGMLNMLRKLIGEDIDLLWMPAANLWPVKMDPAQVDQILANLAANARDSISGVGKITIETGKVEFDEAYCAQHAGFVPGHYAMLAVSDNGCGMDKETCEQIFEPFFTTKEVGKGTGMGLATVYGIVKQNNGFINVYSEPGKGATFKIYLPRLKDERMAIDEPSTHAEPLTGTETVLLVEDNEALLKMGKMMLEELGYTVMAAGSPNEAIELAEQYAGDIHLVLTDVVMPEMSGRDLQRRLSALWPSLKFLFMSGYTANVIAHRGILDEGVHFLQKPFHMEVLAKKVGEALERP